MSLRVVLAMLGVVGAVISLPFVLLTIVLIIEPLLGVGIFDFTITSINGNEIKLSNTEVVAVAFVGTFGTITCLYFAIAGGRLRKPSK